MSGRERTRTAVIGADRRAAQGAADSGEGAGSLSWDLGGEGYQLGGPLPPSWSSSGSPGCKADTAGFLQPGEWWCCAPRPAPGTATGPSFNVQRGQPQPREATITWPSAPGSVCL